MNRTARSRTRAAQRQAGPEGSPDESWQPDQIIEISGIEPTGDERGRGGHSRKRNGSIGKRLVKLEESCGLGLKAEERRLARERFEILPRRMAIHPSERGSAIRRRISTQQEGGWADEIGSKKTESQMTATS